ncbi:prepilin-type N-terminal cleavage/methylation domain-containing protein [Inhella proteolytica]|uniref:Prepilin-type N-terminal cleavage/methylation domain-containing protein n=1 Tax=Inhella proteolytica TaxID=2795029 RepID=A0A931IXL0_9BURK|nr:prepilin-type N-terminal cleavage/methylation domain-containing protein [Inhella proteolytica]MBH9575589.1 prepilin-type N-terminal cleavage/methylation domain-containing protein [Inhella proteolytica]
MNRALMALAQAPTTPRGLSLIELLVVIAVLAIVLAVAGPNFADYIYRKRVEGVAAELVTDIQLLRSQALMKPSATVRNEMGVATALNATIRIGTSSTQTCYMLFWEISSHGCACNRPPGTACFKKFAEIKTVHMPKANTMVVTTTTADRSGRFQAGTPTFSPNGFAVTISGDRNGSLRVSVDGLGRVSTCTPDGGIPNYAVCV